MNTDPDRATRLADLSLDAATRSSDSPDKAKSLAEMAAALASDDPELALALADDIDDPGRKATVLADIAAAVARDISRARELAEQSLVVAADIEDSIGRDWTFARLLGSCRHDTDLALTAAAQTDHPAPGGRRSRQLQPSWQQKRPDRAVRIADLIRHQRVDFRGAHWRYASALARTNPDLG